MTVINLNKYRKQRQHSTAEQKAVANRARFGRTKAERKKDAAEQQRIAAALDQKRLNTEDPGP
jgi:hypothetical protein